MTPLGMNRLVKHGMLHLHVRCLWYLSEGRLTASAIYALWA